MNVCKKNMRIKIEISKFFLLLFSNLVLNSKKKHPFETRYVFVKEAITINILRIIPFIPKRTCYFSTT